MSEDNEKLTAAIESLANESRERGEALQKLAERLAEQDGPPTATTAPATDPTPELSEGELLVDELKGALSRNTTTVPNFWNG
jgi:hypothetical protein